MESRETKKIKEIINDCESSLFHEAKGLLRSRSVCNYLNENYPVLSDEVKRAVKQNAIERIGNCSESLMLLVDSEYKWRLTSPQRCRIHWICPICASLRALKKATEAFIKTEKIMKDNPDLRAYFCVLTAPNQENLNSGFEHIGGAMRKFLSKRRNANSAKKGTRKNKYALKSAITNISGGSYSIEIKRGSQSQIWHPHVNLLLLTESPINFKKFKNEWEQLSGGSNIHFELLQKDSLPKTFFEIFKYALKFQEMSIEDNLEAYGLLKGKRMTGSFGCLRGIDIPKKSLNDKEIIDTRLYQFDGRFFNKL